MLIAVSLRYCCFLLKKPLTTASKTPKLSMQWIFNWQKIEIFKGMCEVLRAAELQKAAVLAHIRNLLKYFREKKNHHHLLLPSIVYNKPARPGVPAAA